MQAIHSTDEIARKSLGYNDHCDIVTIMGSGGSVEAQYLLEGGTLAMWHPQQFSGGEAGKICRAFNGWMVDSGVQNITILGGPEQGGSPKVEA